MRNQIKTDELTERIIGEAFHVHNVLGAGFLEKVYENALMVRLAEAGVLVHQQEPIKVRFEGKVVGEYVADLFVDDRVIVEIKAVGKLVPIFEVQLVNYLKATGVSVGLLINFGSKVVVKRRVYHSASKGLSDVSALI